MLKYYFRNKFKIVKNSDKILIVYVCYTWFSRFILMFIRFLLIAIAKKKKRARTREIGNKTDEPRKNDQNENKIAYQLKKKVYIFDD